MISKLPRMSLFTDPIENTGFAESWTIYFNAFYLNYVAMMGIFIAKVSKGRTIREVAVATIFGMTAGGWFIFGINGSFSIKTFLDGSADVVGLVNSGVGDAAIYSILKVLPGGATLLPFLILLLIVGCVIDNIPATIILAPILLPVVEAIGMSPITFGVMLTMNLAIGFITPPYGINLFMATAVSGVPMDAMMKRIGGLLVSLLVVLMLITYVPWFTMGFLG